MTSRILSSCAALGLVLALGFSAAPARAEEPLVSTLAAMLVTKGPDGKEALAEAKEAAPGDVVEYRISYKNVSEKAIGGLTVTGPIPSSMAYVPNSALSPSGQALEVSIDNGETWDKEPVKRMQKNEKGEMVEVIIPATEYTHVRWLGAGPINPQASIEYKYRAKVQ